MTFEERQKELQGLLHAPMYKMTEAETEIHSQYFARVEMLEEAARHLMDTVKELTQVVNILSNRQMQRDEAERTASEAAANSREVKPQRRQMKYPKRN